MNSLFSLIEKNKKVIAVIFILIAILVIAYFVITYHDKKDENKRKKCKNPLLKYPVCKTCKKGKNFLPPKCDSCKPGFSGDDCSVVLEEEEDVDSCKNPLLKYPECDSCWNGGGFLPPNCDSCKPGFRGDDCSLLFGDEGEYEEEDEGEYEEEDEGVVDSCENPLLKYPECDTCKNPIFKAPDCNTCKNQTRAGPNCDVCKNPLFSFPSCVACKNPLLVAPDCVECKDPLLAAPDCVECKDQENCDLSIYTIDDFVENKSEFRDVKNNVTYITDNTWDRKMYETRNVYYQDYYWVFSSPYEEESFVLGWRIPLRSGKPIYVFKHYDGYYDPNSNVEPPTINFSNQSGVNFPLIKLNGELFVPQGDSKFSTLVTLKN